MLEIIRHSSSTLLRSDFSFIKGFAQENFVGYGPLCKDLEHQLAKKFSRTGVVLTGSGEGALELALHQLQTKNPGKSEVVVSSYVCPAVVSAIIAQGLKPVFADLAKGSLNLGLDDVSQHRLSQHTLAILCTHMGGFPDDVLGAMEFNIPVISDCAQAIGSGIAGKSLLTFGDMSIASFGPTKFMTSGLGGAVLCDGQDSFSIQRFATPELSVEAYKQHGFIRTIGQHVSDLNAGLALAQLEHVGTFVKKRMRIKNRYDKALCDVPNLDFPKKVAGAEPNWFRYYFFSDYAHEWQRRLQLLGIDARNSISHVMTDYFPGEAVREVLAKQTQRVVSIPIYPGLKDNQVTRIVEALQRVAAEITEG